MLVAEYKKMDFIKIQFPKLYVDYGMINFCYFQTF